MAQPGGGCPDPQGFDDAIGSGSSSKGDRQKIQNLIQGIPGQPPGLKDQIKQGLAALNQPEADPNAHPPRWGWYHPIRIEYNGAHRSSLASFLRWLTGSSSRFRYKKSIKKFKQPKQNANINGNVQALLWNTRTSLQAGMANLSQPGQWRTIIRIAPADKNDPTKLDEGSCACGCHAIGS
jgi:hypothetical protein